MHKEEQIERLERNIVTVNNFVAEENRRFIVPLLEVIAYELENEYDKVYSLFEHLENRIEKAKRLYILCGGKQGWFYIAVCEYLNKNQLFYITSEEENGIVGERVYLSIGELKETGFVRKETFIDLFDYMSKSYFYFPEFYRIINKASENVCAKGIITGMSYFRDAIDSNELNATNLAMSSQDLYYDYLMFKKYYSYQMEWVIIGLAPYSLRYDESLSIQQQNRINCYLDCYGDEASHNYYESDNILNIKEKLDIYTPQICQYLYEGVFVNLFGQGEYDMNQFFDEKNIPADEREEITRKYSKPYENTLLENKKILKDYLEECNSLGLRVIVMIPPYTNWYKSHWNGGIYYHELINYLMELGDKMDFELIDLTTQEWDNRYFRNTSHVNAIGRIRVTEIIKSIIDCESKILS